MNANDLLKKQHRLVEDLFERFEKARGNTKPRLFEEIAKNLVAHDAIEREIYYPACERELDDEDILGESLVEHGLVEFSIFRADKNKSSEDLEKYVKVLQEIVEHHVKEEEKELMPKVRRALDKERLDSLGQQMEKRFAEAMKSDFRAPLRNALKQVLEGRMKTTKPPKAKAKAKAKASRAKASPRKASRKGQRAAARRAK